MPEIARYIVNNRDGYAFSAITASIDAEVSFDPIGGDGAESDIGTLHIPMDAKFIINDGQHRRAAIEMALQENPEIGDESIAVVFFLDRGLERCQQLFADLNRHAIRPSKSLGVLYDYRDEYAHIARLVVVKTDIFKDLVEKERSSLSARSRKLFTLSSIYSATIELLNGIDFKDINDAAEISTKYWGEVAKYIPEWQFVRDKKITSGEVRGDYLHSHAIGLQALGMIGNVLLRDYKNSWKTKLKGIGKINWSRSNTKLWEGRAMTAGRLSKTHQHIILTTNALKMKLKLELTPEEERFEEAYAGKKK